MRKVYHLRSLLSRDNYPGFSLFPNAFPKGFPKRRPSYSLRCVYCSLPSKYVTWAVTVSRNRQFDPSWGS